MVCASSVQQEEAGKGWQRREMRARVTEIVRERGVCVVEKKRDRIVGRVAEERDESESD